MVTISDVAKRAKVSISTVSYVLSGRRSVKQETRDRVMKVIEELGYFPSAIATSLVTRRTRTIGVTVTNVQSSLVGDAVSGIEEVTWGRHYSIILCNTHENRERELAAIQVLMEKKVDGIIIVAQSNTWQDIQALHRLKKQGIPIVVINRRLDPSFGQCVMIDNFGGAHRATTHLISLGHKRIGFITGSRGRLSSAERLRGFKAAMREHGLSADVTLVVRGAYGDRGLPLGYEMTKKLVGKNTPPTAILASTDYLAVGAMRAIHESGRRVPGDIAVIGFDNTDFSALVSPALTTVALPMREAGLTAANLLFTAFGSADELRSVATISCPFIVRESCGFKKGLGQDRDSGGVVTVSGSQA